MAHSSSSLEGLLDSVYRSLVRCIIVPELEVEEVDPDSGEKHTEVIIQRDKRFFPKDTAKNVLGYEKLELLFDYLVADPQLRSRSLRPSWLAQNVLDRKLQNFLAILIYSHCRAQALIKFTLNLVATELWGLAEKERANLPTQDVDKLKDILGNDQDVVVDTFLGNQGLFFAAIIRKNQERKYNTWSTVPYQREKLIGEGSFGKIYMVVIAAGHFQYEEGMSNTRGKTLARKDFELTSREKAHEQERNVLRQLVRNARKDANILESMGSVQIGSIYSLFMPLAECDLRQYMSSRPKPPQTWAHKARIVRCAVGLAGAIAYLHDELESEDFEKISCFHMDLKPQNILVFYPDTDDEQWKLSDFNMSRVKPRRKHIDDLRLQPSYTFSDIKDFNKVFKRRAQASNDQSFTDPTVNRRGTGTYLAPEACVDGHPVLAESDIWSLGCVISVILSYLYNGLEAVLEFSELRFKQGNQGLDRFFTFSGGNEPHRMADAHVSDAVKRWFRELKMKTMQRNEDEGIIFRELVNFLEDKVLVIDPAERRKTRAKHIAASLRESGRAYNNIVNGVVPQKEERIRDRIRRFMSIPKPIKTENVNYVRKWDISLPATVKVCEFGPNAHPLVCVMENEIRAYSLNHVCLTENFEDLVEYSGVRPNDEQRSWNGSIGISTQYIVATTNHYEFDCYVFHIDQPGSHTSKLKEVAHVELPLPGIWKIAISPDAKHVAFVLTSTQSNSALYVLSLYQLLSMHDEKSVSIMSSSSQTSSLPNTPLGRPIPLPESAEDIRDIRFSTSNILYTVMKPRENKSLEENAVTIWAWSIRNGNRVPFRPNKITHDGREDLLQELFTSFAPHHGEPAYILLSQEKKLVMHSWATDRKSQSRARGYRLLKLLMDCGDERALALGTKEAHNELRLFTFPIAPPREELKITSSTELPSMTYRSKFAASIYSPEPADKLKPPDKLKPHVWIADIKGSTIRVIPIWIGAHG
ncbi:kinase-like protein [Corynespora cassiicola Philippines]|uniref:Kinase-like protein n=1 Tax=Corynespora cassiicola Philippines TaxID=1448308 RepID=A0A2T2NP13_CORCC|nr:kinase-like protein [Corynespora cassiicola Philippines]